MEMSRVKAELIDEPVALETDMTNLVQKNDSMLPYPNHKNSSSFYVRISLEMLLPTFVSSNIVQLSAELIVRNGSCSVPNKTVFQGDIEAAPRYLRLPPFLYIQMANLLWSWSLFVLVLCPFYLIVYLLDIDTVAITFCI
jgi:hypothetical protein